MHIASFAPLSTWVKMKAFVGNACHGLSAKITSAFSARIIDTRAQTCICVCTRVFRPSNDWWILFQHDSHGGPLRRIHREVYEVKLAGLDPVFRMN